MHEDNCPSLNDCLLTETNLNPDPLNILERFRLHPIAFMADITKALLQISINDKNRGIFRFIWLTGTPDAEDTKSRTSMARVVFGVS